MKSSKPFAFVLWVKDERLPLYLAERVKMMTHFDYFHWIHHKAEKEPKAIIKKASKQPPKQHWHCVVHFCKATDYEMILRGFISLWAKEHPEYGEMPFTFARTHEGKVNNLCTWLAYVIHEPRYMAFIESKCDKPESHKHSYDWNDIKSTDYDLLNLQVQNAVSFVDKCEKTVRDFEDAKERGFDSPRLSDALGHCSNYHQMLVAGAMWKAARIDESRVVQ